MQNEVKANVLQKEKVIQLAKDAGLIFNTELLQSEVHPHHRKALYTFAKFLQRAIQEELAERFEDEESKQKILERF